MGKVTFEFKDGEDDYDIQLVTNRHKLVYALDKLNTFYRNLYNGKLYSADIISIKDNKVLTPELIEESRKAGDYPVSNTKSYISTNYLEEELNDILYDIKQLLD